MGKQLERTDTGIRFQDKHLGCMWNILHVLDHLPWHGSKKSPLHRKHRRGKYSSCYGKPKAPSCSQYCDDVQEYLDAESVPLPVDKQTKNAGPTKLSDKDRFKTVLAKEMSARSEMQQTANVHHLEPSDHVLSNLSTDWTNSIITIRENADTTNFVHIKDYAKLNQNSATVAFSCSKCENLSIQRSLSDNRETSCRQFKECSDVMELFQVNHKLFLEILQDACAQVEHSSMKARLRKTGSFPAATSKHIQFMRPVGLEHKQMEFRSFRKIQKSPVVTEAPKFVASVCLDDSHEKSMASKADAGEGSAICQDTSVSSPIPSQHLEKQRWRQSFTTYFRDIKKKIKLAIKEHRRYKTRLSSVALINRVCSESNLLANKNMTPESLEETTVCQEGEENSTNFHEVNGSENCLHQGDRYALLYEKSSNRKAIWHQYESRSLRLTSEDKFSSDINGLKSFRRRHSLSELEFSCSFTNEIACNVPNEGEKELKSVSIVANGKQFKAQDTPVDFRIQDNMVETGISIENTNSPSFSTDDVDEEINTKGKQGWELVESMKQGSIPCQDQHISPTDISFPKQDQTEFPISQDSETDSKNCSIHEQDASVNLQEKSIGYPSALVCSATICDNANTMTDNHFLYSKWNWRDINDFNYVRDVLEIAGFIEKDQFGIWHSLEQPLNPILFKELEIYLHPELNSADDYPGNCDHHLLFDLLNELLLDIYSSSLAYFPEPLVFTPRHVRPLPRGDQALEEVWKRVSYCRRTQSLVDKSLDDIVAADMASSDGWMNLLLDAEDIALDLEEMIFDQVIDDILCT